MVLIEEAEVGESETMLAKASPDVEEKTCSKLTKRASVLVDLVFVVFKRISDNVSMM